MNDYGTRTDPHAQARAARQAPLLLHSLSCFREIFEVVYAHHPISTVVEVGVESGQVSGIYTELGAEAVYCVDPAPTDSLRAALAGNPALHLVEDHSPDVLPDLPVADLYVLDGDHNYATVRAELAWVLANARDAVVVLHDLLWPCSRRDQYYLPSRLAPEDRHPSSSEGPTVWHDELTRAGFVGLGAFTCAQEAGGERNGVLTAVEDVLTEDWQLAMIPAIFGVGVVTRDEELLDALRPYRDSRLLYTMENNRIALYTRLLQLQYEMVAHAENADTMAETIARQRHDLDRLAAATADLRAEADELRRQNERLRAMLDERPATLADRVLRRQ
ncbi:class I SAM-dependent methyltransferase [Amycolatopsis thermalba]|uniref:class I SAM-dependent methyltransferase n=1 Tax=Amycolatopsis thermalba TaxID=944492 RepID=UPI000E288697|nr:class I SAM-dependent methyltransferase [Amycolatopsis thermalba]